MDDLITWLPQRVAAMSSEREVRTWAGWIGVEISKSRVRTPGKAGYGLYRVRGSQWMRTDNGCWKPGAGQDGFGPSEWTAYAFALEEISLEVQKSIESGLPAGPAPLVLHHSSSKQPVIVSTRWTSAYRGPRDLGIPVL